MHSHYLMTDQFTGPTGTGDDFVPGGRVRIPVGCDLHNFEMNFPARQ